MFIYYWEKKTKIIVLSIIIFISILIIGFIVSLITFYSVYRYIPGKTDFSVKYYTSRDYYNRDVYEVNENGTAYYLQQRKLYPKKEYNIVLSEDEIKEIFDYIIRKNHFFLLKDKFLRLSNDEHMSTSPPYWPDYFYAESYIVVNYNGREKTIAGYSLSELNDFRKISLFLERYLSNIIESEKK